MRPVAVCLQDDYNIIHIKPFGVTVTGIYSGQWADNGHLWYSEWETVDKGNTSENTYAVFELNRWTLDGGNQVIIPDDNPNGRGYISEGYQRSARHIDLNILCKTRELNMKFSFGGRFLVKIGGTP